MSIIVFHSSILSFDNSVLNSARHKPQLHFPVIAPILYHIPSPREETNKKDFEDVLRFIHKQSIDRGNNSLLKSYHNNLHADTSIIDIPEEPFVVNQSELKLPSVIPKTLSRRKKNGIDDKLQGSYPPFSNITDSKMHLNEDIDTQNRIPRLPMLYTLDYPIVSANQTIKKYQAPM